MDSKIANGPGDHTARVPFWDRVPRGASLIAVLWLLGVTIVFSNTGVAWPLWMAFFLAGVILAGWWLLRFAIVAAARLRTRRRIRDLSRLWIVVPLCVVLGAGLTTSNLLLMVRVYLSAGALVASAPALAVAPDLELFERPRRVGLFRVREFTQFDRELRFKTSECGLVDTCGIVYSPGGPPPNRGEDSFYHLYGPWWHWYQSW